MCHVAVLRLVVIAYLDNYLTERIQIYIDNCMYCECYATDQLIKFKLFTKNVARASYYDDMMIVNVAIPQTIIASPNMGSAMIVKVINDNTCFWSATTTG